VEDVKLGVFPYKFGNFLVTKSDWNLTWSKNKMNFGPGKIWQPRVARASISDGQIFGPEVGRRARGCPGRARVTRANISDPQISVTRRQTWPDCFRNIQIKKLLANQAASIKSKCIRLCFLANFQIYSDEWFQDLTLCLLVCEHAKVITGNIYDNIIHAMFPLKSC
jgi:hypothetical protein